MEQASKAITFHESIEDPICNYENRPLEKRAPPKGVTVVRESFYVDKPNHPSRLLLQYWYRNLWPAILSLAVTLLRAFIGDTELLVAFGIVSYFLSPFSLWMLYGTAELTVLAQAGRIRVDELSSSEKRRSFDTTGCVKVYVHKFNFRECFRPARQRYFLEFENGSATRLTSGSSGDDQEAVLQFFASELNDFLQLTASS